MRFIPVAAALIAISGAGCRSAPRATIAGSGPTAAPIAGDEEVARVDGRSITARQVETQARAAGTDARSALQALVDAELLVAEAARRGLDRDAAVREAAEREQVRLFLAGTFEKDVTPADVSDYELRKAYLRVRARIDHPEVRVVRQVFAPFAKGDDEARKRALRARAEQVAAEAKRVRDPAAFSALADKLSDASIRLKAEEFATSRNWNHDPAFIAGAFALKAVGDVSPVVETRFGYHVIYFEQDVPEERFTYEQAKEKLRESLWPDLRRREFARFIDGLVARHRIEERPQLLSTPGEPEGDEAEAAP